MSGFQNGHSPAASDTSYQLVHVQHMGCWMVSWTLGQHQTDQHKHRIISTQRPSKKKQYTTAS